MKKTEPAQRLNPSLWRTTRVLANATRLNLLRTFLEWGEANVSTLAVAEGLSMVRASQELRKLNARGLLAVRREGREVFYRMEADPTIEWMAPLSISLRFALMQHRLSNEDVISIMTAFTHPRRIRMVQYIHAAAGRKATLAELASELGCSRSTAYRHIQKLEARSVLRCAAHEVCLLVPQPGLPETLFNLVLGEAGCLDMEKEHSVA